jgi:hypothetical protein
MHAVLRSGSKSYVGIELDHRIAARNEVRDQFKVAALSEAVKVDEAIWINELGPHGEQLPLLVKQAIHLQRCAIQVVREQIEILVAEHHEQPMRRKAAPDRPESRAPILRTQ